MTPSTPHAPLADTVTPEDLGKAKKRLRSAFAFIGLTDFWNQSICLFHAQHGGEPIESEFMNSRLSASYSKRSYDCSPLMIADEPFDTMLYHTGLGHFAERLCRFGFIVPDELRSKLKDTQFLALCDKGGANAVGGVTSQRSGARRVIVGP